MASEINKHWSPFRVSDRILYLLSDEIVLPFHTLSLESLLGKIVAF